MTSSFISPCSFESSLVRLLFDSSALSSFVVLVAAVGLGLGYELVKLDTISAPGLDRPSLPESAMEFLELDQRPAEGDAVSLLLWRFCMYFDVDPELIVLRTLPNELFQLLYGSPSEKGDSMGLFAAGDPVNLRR